MHGDGECDWNDGVSNGVQANVLMARDLADGQDRLPRSSLGDQTQIGRYDNKSIAREPDLGFMFITRLYWQQLW
jgi:hypothetical protein